MKELLKHFKTCDKAAAAVSSAVGVMSLVDIIRYAVLGQPVALLTVIVVNALFMLVAAAALFGRLHALYALIAVFAAVLFFTTNNFGTTLFNFTYVLQAVVAAVGAVAGTALAVINKDKPKIKPALVLSAIAAIIVAVFGIVWGACVASAKNITTAQAERWAVPTAFDKTDCPQKGALEKIDYATKAYATDGREVEKSAYVYLPYGYNGENRYNILYLLHGTGDDEEYWLKKHSYNVTMIDNLIYSGVIEPLIVVTPTFYTENDCFGDLDPLTYSFKDELRNDLMPAVESKYSTFAQTSDDEGFKNSRTHRAFAGLSRGAVTTLHSVLCGSLDYFSSFGTFSASRTELAEYEKANLTGAAKELSIDYWYVASGAFDFGFASQWHDWNEIVKADPRLTVGENTAFDNYPMRYHSMGNWHLALYNFLLKIF